MNKLSLLTSFMKSHYSVVVIGTGYGGGIAASRLARAGRDVCVLERGKEWQAGDFPETTVSAFSEMQVDTPEGHLGSKLGLFDFRINKEMSTLLGCGLGGTSLINASVSVRPDKQVFTDPIWPSAFRQDIETALEEGYARAEGMLKPVVYPEHFPTLAKQQALQKSAEYLNKPFAKVPINVNFEEGMNHVGVHQQACTLCGDCVTGCNHSAKNTITLNYLPDAKNHGAEIYTQIHVKYIEQQDERWLVHYEVQGDDGQNATGETKTVRADIVILAAGTLGSTEILLRSKEQGLLVSDKVGHRFSSNGDVLGFSYDSSEKINGIGFGTHLDESMERVGPCITSVIDTREGTALNEGMFIEEGSIPGALAPLLPLTFEIASALIGEKEAQETANEVATTAETLEQEAQPSLLDAMKQRLGSIEQLMDETHHEAIKYTQTYLVMSHDDSDGKLILQDDRIRIDWPEVGEKPIFTKINETLEQATEAIDGTYVKNPIWSKMTDYDLITVHPLGGCSMGEDAKTGVVNHKGQVFAGNAGDAVYQGLYVCDGSVIPRSLGVNPSLTISAVAERVCSLLAQDYEWEINYDIASFQPTLPKAEGPGIEFTETMSGSSLEFTVTIHFENLEKALRDPAHQASIISGTVLAPELSDSPMVVDNGEFHLFVTDPERVETKEMLYRMKLNSREGKTFFLTGRKMIHDDHGFDLWRDTTTLYYQVFAGEDEHQPVVGEGVLRISIANFAKQLTTIHATNTQDHLEKLATIAKFGHYFFGALFDIYGGIFAKETVFNPDAPPRKKRPLRVPTPEVHSVQTADGVALRLIRYQGGSKGPVMLAHGVGQSSLMYAIDTIDTNLLEYLCAHGYDCWLLDWRGSVALEFSKHQFTCDEVAAYDYPAAVAKVRGISGAASVQVIAHCVASITFHMAMLSGLEGVRSAVALQIGTHMELPFLNRMKAGLYVPNVLDALGVESLNAYVDIHADWKSKLFDNVCKLYPIHDEDECHNAVCHRNAFMYGIVFNHAQLNEESHDTIHEYFGATNIHMFEHLTLIGREGHIVSATGEDNYLPHAERLAIPITYIHGGVNKVFLPESTEKTYELLCKRNGKELYHRYEIPDYGHCDCVIGKQASTDVFPLILKHLDQWE